MKVNDDLNELESSLQRGEPIVCGTPDVPFIVYVVTAYSNGRIVCWSRTLLSADAICRMIDSFSESGINYDSIRVIRCDVSDWLDDPVFQSPPKFLSLSQLLECERKCKSCRLSVK